MKKILSLLTVFILILAGCGGSNTNEDEEQVVNFALYSVTPDKEETLKQIISDFEAENPKIKINYEITPYADYFTKLQTNIAGGNGPDVFELNYENSVTYYENGATKNLNELLTEEAKKGFDTTALSGFATTSGEQFGLPASFSTVLTYYNKDLFDQAGVQYPTDDWTWEDEISAAEKLTDAQNGVYGLVAPYSYNEYYKTVAQNGGALFNEDNSVATINSQENEEALKYMIDAIENGYTPANLGPDEDTNLFKNQKAAMFTTGSWMFGAFADVDFAWDVVTEAGNTQKANHYFSNAVAMSSSTKKEAAAYKWMEYYTLNSNVQKMKVENDWETPAVNDADVIKAYEEKSNGEDRSKVFKSLENGVNPPIPAGVSASELADTIDGAIQEAKLGNITIKDALEKAQSDVEKLMK